VWLFVLLCVCSAMTSNGTRIPCQVIKQGAESGSNIIVKTFVQPQPATAIVSKDDLKSLVSVSSSSIFNTKGLHKSMIVYALLKLDNDDQKQLKEATVFQECRPGQSQANVMIPSLSQLKTLGLDQIYVPKEDGLSVGGGKGRGGVVVGEFTRAGFMANKQDPTKRKLNQDRFVVIRGVGGSKDVDLFGVLDGHGDDGHFVSEYVKTLLPQIINKISLKTLMSNPANSLKTVVAKVIAKLKKVKENKKIQDKAVPKFDVETSGTTCCISLRIKSVLHTLNIGDSRVVLISKQQVQKDTSAGDDDAKKKSKTMKINIVAKALSRDHKPTDPEERQRIILAGGRCAKLGPKDPMRVLPRYANFPGLAVTRTVGDFWGEGIGLTALPEMSVHELTSNDLAAVWASDGIWEWLPNSIVSQILFRHIQDPNKACYELVQRAKHLWNMKTDGSYHDDITCVVARFD